MKSDRSNLVKFCLGGMTLSELVKSDKQAKEAAKGLYDSPTLPQTGTYTIEGGNRNKAMYSMTIESETPWKGGTFKQFCEHWTVQEWHTDAPPK